MVNYKNGKIYKLVNDELNLTYYGSTCNELRKRLNDHKKKSNKCSSKIMFESGVVKIYLVEEFPTENKMLLNQRERYYIENNECVNKVIPGRTRKEYRDDNKYKINITEKEYYNNNKDKIIEKKKEYYQNNKDKIKEYYQNNKDKIKERAKEFNENNKEKRKQYLKQYLKEYYENNKDKRKVYYKENKEKILSRQKKWRDNKKLKLKELELKELELKELEDDEK